eukprot:TRINITY_DN2020_c4_g1_i1.p1 TRINITY_DN2020_c4_g1~~TRINITY_DN2020_c4_g1_i1.p1  ORF type:complete len:756 (+),score=171.13 TRINITY_DN2020_c4_g1_i1:29-2296(+)
MDRYLHSSDGSVQALKKELQEERIKSMKVEDMFKELCGELGFERGIESEAEEPVQVPPTSPDPKRSLSPTPPTPLSEGNRISSLFSTLGAPNYSDRPDHMADGVVKAPGASPHFSVPINSVYPDVREDVFAPEPLDVIPRPEVQQTPPSSSNLLQTSPVVVSMRSQSATSDPPTTSLPSMSAGGEATSRVATTSSDYLSSHQQQQQHQQHSSSSQVEYYNLHQSSPVPRVSTSVAGSSANPPVLQGARTSIATNRSSYVSSASSAPKLQGRTQLATSQVPVSHISNGIGGEVSHNSINNNNNNNNNNNSRFGVGQSTQPPARIVTPSIPTVPMEAGSKSINTTTAAPGPAVEEEMKKWLQDGLSPIKQLSPLLSRVFDDLMASANFSKLPSVRHFKTVEDLRKQEWKEAVLGLISSQRFLSPFLKDGDILFGDQLKSSAAVIINKHTPTMRCVITGPKDCGKSTYLHIFSQELVERLLLSNTFNNVFILPIDWDIFLGCASIDLGIIYCQLVSHFVDCLAAQRPAIRRWKSQLTSYWKKVVTQSRAPSLPSEFVSEFEDVSISWRALCGTLQSSYAAFEYEKFILILMSLPDAFAKAFGFERITWLVDNFVSLQSQVASDGKGSAVPSGLTLQSGMMSALRSDISYCVLTAEDDSHIYNLDGKISAPVQGLVTQSELTKLFPGLPSVVRCNGKEYGVSVFCGCPGYLVPFVKLFEASIPTQKAEDGIQRSVEFYGSDVETLLERLAQISWERGTA